MLCSIRAPSLCFIFILTETRILRTPLETRIYEPSSYTCRDGETESRDVVWAAGHAGAVGEGWQGRGDCAVAGDNETLLLFSAGGVFKGHQLPRLHRARRQRWLQWPRCGGMQCVQSLVGGRWLCNFTVNFQHQINRISSRFGLPAPVASGGHFYHYLSINVPVTFTDISTDCISIYFTNNFLFQIYVFIK